MSVIHLYTNRETTKTYALKMMKPEGEGKPEAVDRFFQEIKITAGLDHPNIVNVVSYGILESDYCFAMEYISGGSLNELLRKRYVTPPEFALFILLDILKGISHAHREGVVHQDLKPSNILLDESGWAKISDFGISNVSDLSRDGRRNGIAGTPAYMSPEQTIGGEVDQRSDLFSAGIIFYEMLSGHNPYLSDNPGKTTINILNKPYISLLKYNPTLPEYLDNFAYRVLKKDPDERFQSAAEMMHEARKILHKLDKNFDRKKFSHFLTEPGPAEIESRKRRTRRCLARSAACLKKNRKAEAVIHLYRAYLLSPKDKDIIKKFEELSETHRFYPNVKDVPEIDELEQKLYDDPFNPDHLSRMAELSKKHRDPFRYRLYSRNLKFLGDDPNNLQLISSSYKREYEGPVDENAENENNQMSTVILTQDDEQPEKEKESFGLRKDSLATMILTEAESRAKPDAERSKLLKQQLRRKLMEEKKHKKQDFRRKQLRPAFEILLMLLPAMPALIPLFYFGFPNNPQTQNFLLRSMEHYSAFTEGVLFPRWSAHTASGYGMPLFIYFAPLFYFCVSILKFLGFGYIQAMQWLAGGCTLAASMGCGFIVWNLFGLGAGIFAASLFVYSPYFLSIIYSQGNFQELPALTSGIWMLGFIVALIKNNSFWYIAGAVLALSCMILSCIPTTLAFLPFIILISLAGGKNKLNSLKPRSIQLSFILVLAFILTAVFWMPALLERDSVHIPPLQAAVHQWGNDFLESCRNFTTVSPLVHPDNPNDVFRVSGGFPYIYPILLLAFPALFFRLIFQKNNRTNFLLAVLVMIALSLILTTQFSRFLWQNLTYFKVIRLPSNFYPIAVIGFSIIGGSMIYLLAKLKNKFIRISGLILLVLLFLSSAGMNFYHVMTLPNNFSIFHSGFRKMLTPKKLAESGSTLTENDKYMPLDAVPLDYKKYEYTILKGDCTFQDAAVETHKTAGIIEAENYSTIRFERYHFPGWSATIDGYPIKINKDDEGRILLKISPINESRLEVSFRNTGLRSLSAVISLFGILTLAAACMVRKKYRSYN